MSDKRNWHKVIPVVSIIICVVSFLLLGWWLTGQDLAEWVPKNRSTSVLIVIFLYAVKSLTVVFPLITVYLLCGILFPLPMAILVNLLGLVVCDTIPYLLGKKLGSRFLDRLRQNYPKLEILETLREGSGFQFVVLTRSAGVLPGDVVSLYFGCVRLNYFPYLTGSVLGLTPGMIATTILGNQVSDPGTPGFWVAAGCSFAVACFSFLACRRTIKQSKTIDRDRLS